MTELPWPSLPAIPDWLEDAPRLFADTATRIGTVAERIDTVRATLRATLGESAAAFGWSGIASGSAANAAAERCDQLATLRDLIAGVGLELAAAAARLDEHRDGLRHAGVHALLGIANPLTTLWTAHEVDRLVDYARDDDRAVAGNLDALADGLHGLARPMYAAGWVEAVAPTGSTPWLRERGVLPLVEVGDLVRWASALPPGTAATGRLRDRLYAVPGDELPPLLEAHPSIAARLAADGAVPAVLAAALAHPPGSARVAAVRDAFGQLTARERRTLALLYPRTVGSLDGAPFADRVAANRVLVRAALEDELARRAAIFAPLDERRAHTSPADLVGDSLSGLWDAANDLAPVQKLIGEFGGDPAAMAAANDARIALYRSLLADGRRVLSFDPSGDGELVELFGTLDAGTEHVAVLVPGTGTDLESYEGWADIARDFRNQDPGLATVAWLGGNLPDTLPAAALRSYAEESAPRLRDFAAGLDVPPRADVTVLGYSYGGAVVGVAEREGLVADRVLHVASAGAGAGVDSLDDYAGGVREHYTMTAPGDPIAYVRGVDVGPVGHGADPDGMAGFVRIPTGCYGPDDPERSGERIDGLAAHWEVFSRGSTAWAAMAAVMGGRPLDRIPECRP